MLSFIGSAFLSPKLRREDSWNLKSSGSHSFRGRSFSSPRHLSWKPTKSDRQRHAFTFASANGSAEEVPEPSVKVTKPAEGVFIQGFSLVEDPIDMKSSGRVDRRRVSKFAPDIVLEAMEREEQNVSSPMEAFVEILENGFVPAFSTAELEARKSDKLAGQTVVVTGCGRGIGLELTSQLLSRGCKVVGFCRTPTRAVQEQLDTSGRHFLCVQTDLSFEKAIEVAARKIQERVAKVDILLNVAGLYSKSGLNEVTAEEMEQLFMVNAAAPIFLARALLPLLRRSRASPRMILNVSSKVASVSDNRSGGRYAYRASKMALNIMNKSLAIDLEPDRICCTLLHPGYVKTDMTGHAGLIDASTSAGGLLKVVEGLTLEDSGKWLDWQGKEIDW